MPRVESDVAFLHRRGDKDLRGELERNEMAHVHRITTRSSTSVEIERLFFLISIKNQVEITTLGQLQS